MIDVLRPMSRREHERETSAIGPSLAGEHGADACTGKLRMQPHRVAAARMFQRLNRKGSSREAYASRTHPRTEPIDEH